jgi:hypothetical protein
MTKEAKTTQNPPAKVIHAAEPPKDYRRPDPKNPWTMNPYIGTN